MSLVKITKILSAETLSDTSPGLTQTKYTEFQDISKHNFALDIGIVLVNAGTSTDIDVYYEFGMPTLDKNVAIGSGTLVGSGLDDITVAGTFNAPLPTLWRPFQRRYRVQVDATGSPDTYKYSSNDGESWDEEGISMTTSAVELGNSGITVLWAANTGHVLNEHWDFDVTNLVWFNSTKNIDAASIASSRTLDSETLKPGKYIRFLVDNQSGSATAIVSMYLITQM
ncbi:hypothetical protein LCGC14_0399310 [marine sediment metagenome]|uniref:Uncharacterized protein n=1 Tax=marine sediment metagenome TaxID=412755 RepID=A0A0F9SXG6_9ZZZZ